MVITVNPALITNDKLGQEGCFKGSKQMLRHCCFYQLLESWGQIWQQHDAGPIQQSESAGTSHNQFQSHQKNLQRFNINPQ
jgi:hypothetical protein